jgi:hypothetical protein
MEDAGAGVPLVRSSCCIVKVFSWNFVHWLVVFSSGDMTEMKLRGSANNRSMPSDQSQNLCH